MKIINDYGNDITKEYEETIAKLREALTFYADEKHFHWDGCHCHGHNVIDDHGETAKDALEALNSFEYQEEE